MNDKRQKVMIGVLAVAVLGAGGYWFVLRDSGDSAPTMGLTNTGEKKVRKRSSDSDKKKTRKKREKRAKTERAERAVREKSTRSTASKKNRRKGRKAVKKKKKTLPPAAYVVPAEEWLEEFRPEEFRPRFV